MRVPKSGVKCDICDEDMERIDDGQLSGQQVFKCKCGAMKTFPVKKSRLSFNLNDPRDPLRGGLK